MKFFLSYLRSRRKTLLFFLLLFALLCFSFLLYHLPPEAVVYPMLLGVLLGLGFLAVDIRRRFLLRRAYEGGNRVDARILGVVTQRNVNTTYGSPRMLQAAWTDPNGIVHVYHSRYLNMDVTSLLTSDTVPVYIDRYNENIGFVDIDAILPEIRIHP